MSDIDLGIMTVFLSGMTNQSGGDSFSHKHPDDRLRANHTGTQLASTISDFSEAVDDRLAVVFVAGSGISTAYNDAANIFVVNETHPSSNGRIASDQTTTSTALGNITGLSFVLAANEGWSYWAGLKTGCSGTGGLQVSVNVPSGASVMCAVQGIANSTSTYRSNVITASDGNGPTVNDFVATSGWVTLDGSVLNGATPGNLQLRFKSVVNGQTSTVYTGSFINASKL